MMQSQNPVMTPPVQNNNNAIPNAFQPSQNPSTVAPPPPMMMIQNLATNPATRPPPPSTSMMDAHFDVPSMMETTGIQQNQLMSYPSQSIP